MVASGATILASRSALSPPTAFKREPDRGAARSRGDGFAQVLVVEQDDVTALRAQLLDELCSPNDVNGLVTELARNLEARPVRRRSWRRFE